MMERGSPRESPVPTGLRDRTGHRDCNGTDGTEESLGIPCTHGTED